MLRWNVAGALRFFRALQTSRVLHNAIVHAKTASFLGNMVKCTGLSICLMFSSSEYVERSGYANVFKLNRENKRFERAKVNSRCFHWFRSPCYMLEPSDGLQHGVSITNTIIFRDTLCRITRVWNIAHPRNFGTLFIYYSSKMFQFLDSIYWMVYGKRFYFSLAW